MSTAQDLEQHRNRGRLESNTIDFEHSGGNS